MLNKQYGGQLRALLSQPELAAEEALFISIDKLGADIRVRKGIEYVVERVGWDTVGAGGRRIAVRTCAQGDRIRVGACGVGTRYARLYFFRFIFISTRVHRYLVWGVGACGVGRGGCTPLSPCFFSHVRMWWGSVCTCMRA